MEVLRGINLQIEKGEIVTLVGASGAGKSTLLHIIGTLEKPDSGTVSIDNEDISNLKGNRLSRFRNEKLGFVFQFHHLLPEFSAMENVCMPAWVAGRSKSESEKEATELLDFLGLKDRLNHRPAALSGGEQQRVAVARALINRPKVVLADEPSGNLDSANAEELHQWFFRLRDNFGYTFLIVTHNEKLAGMADRTVEMKDGLIFSTTGSVAKQ